MNRIRSADAARVIAIVAVIGLHTALYKGPDAIGRTLDTATFINIVERFAVPMFFVLSGFFFASQCGNGEAFASRSITLSKRVAVIFLVWSLVYLIAPVGENFRDFGMTGNVKAFYWLARSTGGVWRALMEGPKVHLWFLPGLVCAALLSGLGLAMGRPRVLLAAACALFAVGLAGGAYANSPFGFHSTLMFRDGPFFSLLFFVTGTLLARVEDRSRWLALGVALAVGGFLLQLAEVQWLHDHWGGALANDYVVSTYPYGVGMALIALSDLRLGPGARLAALGPLVLGIYASHYLFVDLLRPIDAAHHRQVAWDVAYVALVFMLSLGTTFALSRFRLTRRFVM